MSAINYDGRGDPEFVADRLADFRQSSAPDADALTHAETREFVENGAAADTVTLEVDGETVGLDSPPAGVGKYRPLTELVEAEERGQDGEALRTLMSMTDRLVEHSDRPAEWWDQRSEQTVVDTYGDWIRQGAAGNARMR